MKLFKLSPLGHSKIVIDFFILQRLSILYMVSEVLNNDILNNFISWLGPSLKYHFSKFDDSGNCIIRNICCIVFDLKRNVG